MTTSRLRRMTQTAFALVAGASYGFAIAGIGETRFALIALLLMLAVAAEWVEVRFGPLGELTLRPVIAFVGLWAGGISTFLIVSMAPLMVMQFFRRAALPEILAPAGRDAVGAWTAYLVFTSLKVFIGSNWGHVGLASLIAPACSFLAYWIVQVPLQALDLSQSEGVRYGAGIRHIVRYISPHIAALTFFAVVLTYVITNFGLVVMGIAAIALIEGYYPWKLLGDQSGILITSLQVMAQAIDLKDPYTSNHSQQVSRYAVRIARAMGLPEDEVERIRIGGLMHDIGKISISGRIIRKPGKLTPEEKALMNRHSSVSADIIEHLEILGESAKMVRHHHEHCDGSGYPDGLKGEEIPIGSRIILVADAYDALTTDRPYRKGAPRAKAVSVISENAGTQFDQTAVEALVRISPSL